MGDARITGGDRSDGSSPSPRLSCMQKGETGACHCISQEMYRVAVDFRFLDSNKEEAFVFRTETMIRCDAFSHFLV